MEEQVLGLAVLAQVEVLTDRALVAHAHDRRHLADVTDVVLVRGAAFGLTHDAALSQGLEHLGRDLVNELAHLLLEEMATLVAASRASVTATMAVPVSVVVVGALGLFLGRGLSIAVGAAA